MRPLGETIEALREWAEAGAVGNIVFYHPPGLKSYGCYIERTIKAREMEPHVREAFETLMNELGALKGEFHRDKDGRPDRVKIVKAL